MKLKKLIAVLLSAMLILGGLAFGAVNAFAITVTITDALLGTDITKTTSGYDDNVWYVYTPSQSGIYTLYGLGENIVATEAYLFSKTEDADGKKLYTQLAYSNGNPDYANYEGAGRRQFCLKYHLNEGETYYYAAGWNNAELTGTRSLGVRFICESYDTAELISITPSCNAELTWYTDGSWEKDDDGNSYYLYNISKIMQNMSLTLEFDDGTVITSSAGDATVGGYPITYTHNQQGVHWYNKNNENYTANTLTIKVLDKSVDYEVTVNESALLTVSGKVVDDYDGSALPNAEIYIGVNKVAVTDKDGIFSFAYSPGTHNMSIRGDNILDRNLTLTVDTSDVSKNNHKDTPVSVVVVDYVDDDVINGRDYAYIKSNLTGTEFETAKAKFNSRVGFAASDYEKIIL